MTNETPKYRLKIGLNVLEHLGINLYSNIPSVLSEIVANAWDADATEVRLTFNDNEQTITISDNGSGMTEEEVNDRFLYVGYQRRKNQDPLTGLGRMPMGRKGIGKLSLFSIAGIIEVSTVKDGHKNAFRMVRNDIKSAIEANDTDQYIPEVLPTDEINFTKGTCIKLNDLRRRKTALTPDALRKRIARRFSIIGAKENFSVYVDDVEITPSDRGYYDKLQFIWTYSDQSEVTSLCTGLANTPEDRSQSLQESKIEVTGWIGAVLESGQLKDNNSDDNLNRIAIFIRGKMAQEDILSDFGEQGVYSNYLIGELRVDFLDTDDGDEATTSNRQKIHEDDPRYIDLKDFIKKELKHIQGQWTNLRTEEGARTAMKIPAVDRWVKSLNASQQKSAKSLIGRIYRLQTSSESERRELLKHAVFAFEFHRANETLIDLQEITDENLSEILRRFKDLDFLEESFYGQIVRQRVGIIRTFKDKIDEKSKENVIQQYLFNHLWLLDPNWERIEGEEFMETRVSKLFEEVDGKLTKEEKNARIDIKYRQSAGTHIVVELKKPDRRVGIDDLTKQIRKYRTGMKKLLDEAGRGHEPLSFVLLLGKRPAEWDGVNGPSEVENALKILDARIVLYDNLLDNAHKCYSEYLKRSKGLESVEKVISAIDDTPLSHNTN